MAKSVNKVILIGNVGRDPEVRYTQNGTPVANFSMATTESFKGQNGEWQEKTEWHDIVCWRFLAERAEKYVNKGSRLYIEGKLQTRSWEGQDGKKNYRTEVVATDMMMLDSRGGGQGGGQGGSGGGNYEGNFQAGDVNEDDIPF
jgi:single-strand DNA-binding protein